MLSLWQTLWDGLATVEDPPVELSADPFVTAQRVLVRHRRQNPRWKHGYVRRLVTWWAVLITAGLGLWLWSGLMESPAPLLPLLAGLTPAFGVLAALLACLPPPNPRDPA